MDKQKCDKKQYFVTNAIQEAGRVAQQAVHAVADAVAATFGNKELVISSHNATDNNEQMPAETSAREDENRATPQSGSIPDSEIIKLLRVSGTAVWKLGQRMLDEETKEPKTDEFRRLWRHVESIKDALAEIGVEVIDWTGRRYDEGMSLKVVAEEERVGTKEVEIVETLLPTIRFRKRVQLQQGEVVVSRPFREEKNNPRKANDGDGGNE